MQTVLVIGASRGIGAEFVRQYLDDGAAVHATVRDLATPAELSGLDGNLVLHPLDVKHPEEIEQLAGDVAEVGLDLVVHNAGIYRGHSREDLMAVNAEAPIRMIESLLTQKAIGPGTKVAIMTSQAGARRGGSPSLGAYGKSKAALNDEFRRRAKGWATAGLVAVVVHPGWVRTDMGGPAAPVGVEESVTGMRSLFAAMTPQHHGRFWSWDGREMQW